MIRPAIKHTLEFAAGLVAVIGLLVGGLIWQLSQGPLPLNYMSPNIADILNRNLEGYEVAFSEVYLRKSNSVDALDITVRDASVLSASGEEIARFPEIDIQFDLGVLLRGVVAPSRIEIVGASALAMRREDGGFGLGLSEGPLSQQPAEEPLPAVTEPSLQDQVSASFFESLLQSFLEPVDPDSPLAYLTEFVLREGELTFIDENTGGAWQAMDATITFARQVNGISAFLEAGLQVADGVAQINVNSVYDRLTDQTTIEADISDVLLSELAADSGEALHPLKRIELPVKASTLVSFSSQGRVEDFDMVLEAGKGVINIDGVRMKDENAPPDPFDPTQPWAYEGEYTDPNVDPPTLESVDIDQARLHVTLTKPGYFELRELKVNGPANHIDMVGSVQVNHNESANAIESADVNLSAKETSLTIGGFFGETIKVDTLNLSAGADYTTRTFTLDDLSFSASGASGAFNGEVVEAYTDDGQLSPAVTLQGRVRQLPILDLTKFWPLFVGMGGRDWIVGNIDQGVISRAELNVNIPAGVLGSGPLPDDVLRVDFAFRDGIVHYIRPMTPMQNVQGSGTLYANSLRIDVETGQVGTLQFSNGEVYIPRLNPKGAVAQFGGTAEGDTAEIMALIDMEPLKLTRKFGISPETMGGQSKVDFKVGRPMRRKVPIYAVTYEAEAEARNLSLPPVFGDLPFEDGRLQLSVTTKGIAGVGGMTLAGVPASLKWSEKFDQGDKPSTEYIVTIDTDAKNYTKLGYPIDGILEGPVKTTVRTSGKGMNIQSASLSSNFDDAVMDIMPFHYFKEKGLPGKTTFDIQFADGVRNFNNIRVSGHELDVQGNLRLADDLRVLKADFPIFKMGEDMDFTLKGARNLSDDRLTLDLSGERFDAGSIVYDYLMESSGEGSDTPLTINGDVKQVRMNQNVYLLNTKMYLRSNNVQLTDLEVDASLPGGGGMFVGMAGPTTSGRFHMTASSSDAGALIGGVYDVASVSGGALDVAMFIDPPTVSVKDGKPTTGKMYGDVTIEDFRVVDLPLLARLLSAAGSLSGLADLLNGDGIAFDNLYVPFVMGEESIEFSDVQAAGPSVGVTMEGVFFREPEEVQFKGTLVPAYTINRIFGRVPILGDWLVSRQGEGILGFTYNIDGPLDQARIFVNPLSALAPGLFRRLFQMGGPDVERPPKPGDLPEDPVMESMTRDEEVGVINPEENKILPKPKPEPEDQGSRP